MENRKARAESRDKTFLVTAVATVVAALVLILFIIHLHPEQALAGGTTSSASTNSTTGIAVAVDVSELTLEKDENGDLCTFYNGQKYVDYSGLFQGDPSVYFVRNGTVDSDFVGIVEGTANGEEGQWYVYNGKVANLYSGSQTFSGTTYVIKNGKVESSYEVSTTVAN